MKHIIYLLLLSLLLTSSLKAEINSQTLAVLVNKNDPESIEIAKYYQQARNIPENNIIFLSFKAGKNALSEPEFKIIEAQLKQKTNDNIQAYALAWRKPWRVDCMSITSAFALGFNRKYCAKACGLTQKVGYYSSQSTQPYIDFAIRPSMLLSAGNLNQVKRLIDRGVASDYSRPKGSAYLLSTSDKNRNVRAVYFPAIKKTLGRLLNIENINADAIKNKNDIMFYFTGLTQVKSIRSNKFLPGAIADHLTSTGGHLFNGSQMSALKWVDAGATATYGTVVEPCNFQSKFPSPGIVMQQYLSGSTLLEAYWKSVEMPGQGVFVGEPLSVPYRGCKIIRNHAGILQYVLNQAENYVYKTSKNCH